MPPEGQAQLSFTTDSTLSEWGVWLPGLPGTGWNIRDFGPMLVPRAGMTLRLDSLGCKIYAKSIEYESGHWPVEGDVYTFKKDWYFFGGDNVLNSRDSRYIGLVPKDFVIGRVLSPRRKSSLRKKNRSLEKALEFAGDNRGELEAVLYHYRNDERKKEAAQWLIRNMPDQYGYAPFEELDSVKSILRDLKAERPVPMELIHKWRGVNLWRFKRIYDSKVISSSYLISNIDQAFDAFDSRPWNRHLKEDEFYELILPYRVGNEPLGENWRQLYKHHYGWILDSLYTGSDVIKAVEAVHLQMEGDYFRYNTYFRPPSLGPEFLMYTRIGVCKEICEFTLFLMRSLGIPVATDYNAMRSVHSWNTVLDTTGRYELFWMDQFKGTQISRGGGDGRRKGKVFRRTFAKPHRKDVSDSYFGKSDILVPFRGVDPVWMGLFTEGRWYSAEPVKNMGPIAIFHNVEPGLAFIPMVNDRVAGYPVILDGESRRTQRLIPDFHHPVSVKVSRKTRLQERIRQMMAESEGISFEASNTPSFRSYEKIGICGAPRSNYNYLPVRVVAPFRYLKIVPPKGKRIQLAEIRLFGDTSLQDTISASSVIGPPDASLLIDSDELTYYLADQEDCSVILDLGEKQLVSMIEWVPRNDDNFLRHRDVYELLYQDGLRGWKSIGIQTAYDSVLVFKNAPSNALFRLHNMTRGKEEEVFTLLKGEQVFH